jgi:hypothetical protein
MAMETIDRDDGRRDGRGGPIGGQLRGAVRADDRSFFALLPWRNFRRAFFLILALLAVVAIKKTGGGLFRNLLDSVAPPAARAVPTTVHLQVPPPDPR